MRLVTDLFVVENQVQLIAGFNSFLPPGYTIDKDLNFQMPGDPISNFYLGRDNLMDVNPDIFDLDAGGTVPASEHMRNDDDQKPDRKIEEEKPATFNAPLGHGSFDINPIFLEKSDELIKAELYLQRQRLERALKDEVDQKKAATKNPAQGETFLEFDFDAFASS